MNDEPQPDLTADFIERFREVERKLREKGPSDEIGPLKKELEQCKAGAAALAEERDKLEAANGKLAEERDGLKADNGKLTIRVGLLEQECLGLREQNRQLSEEVERSRRDREELEATIAGPVSKAEEQKRRLREAEKELEAARTQTFWLRKKLFECENKNGG